MTIDKSLTYQSAGVDIQAGTDFIDKIKMVTRSTHRPGVLTGLGGFGALFELPLQQYKQPVLVSSTDGVGTKLKLALELNNHSTIGIDLVAMCVNDIIVGGAEPLFFLDYFATGHLEIDKATTIVTGIAEGCKQAGAALVGGETAEMPGMYHGDDYDLAGFCVGIVEKDKIIDGSQISSNDVLIGIASSGPHANGYSLIRKIIEVNQVDLNTPFGNTTIGDTLLAPTKIYVQALLELLKHQPVNGMAHITGGGILENLPRVLPNNILAIIDNQSWQWPEIFHWIQKQGNIETQEMYRTFNCGVGMIICVPPHAVDKSLALLKSHGEKAWVIGHTEKREDKESSVICS